MRYLGNIAIDAFLPGVTPVLVSAQASLSFTLTGTGAQLTGAIQALANLELQVSDPIIYINSLLAGTVQAQVNISGSIPSVALGLQIAAAAGIVANLQLTVGDITASVDLVASLLALLGGASGHAFSFQSQLGAVGGEFDAVSPDTGIAPTATVVGVTFLAAATSTADVEAIRTVFKVN